MTQLDPRPNPRPTAPTRKSRVMATSTTTPTQRHPVDQVLPAPQMFIYGLQHVLSMYAGVVAVPLVIGSALKLSGADLTYLVSAGLFMSGVATLLQTLGIWKIGARQPLVQGTSFAAVSTMLAIAAQHGGGRVGLRAIFGALLLSSIIGFVIAPLFTRLLRFFPEVVTGTVITIIGISLLPVGIEWAGGGTPGVTPDYGAPKNILVATLTLAIIVAIYRIAPGFLSRVAILLGLVLGTIVAIPFGITNFGNIKDAQVFQLTSPLHFGTPIFAVSATISMVVVMLVIMTETTADILAIGEVVDRPADRSTVTNGLRADMLATSVSSVFNGFSVSAFAQNVGLVAITGIKSRFVVAVSGGILVFLGLFPILGALVALVPQPVLGGAGVALFGTVAASGIRTLSRVDFSGNANIVIVALSLGAGIIPIASPTFYDKFPGWFSVIFGSGITAAALTAVLLNIVFNILGRKDNAEGPIFSEGPAPAYISDADEARLQPGHNVDPETGSIAIRVPTTLQEFNTMPEAQAEQLLRPCADVDRWVHVLAEHRPYYSIKSLTATAESVASPFSAEEVESALHHHPRIGALVDGTSREASLSRAEQSGLHLDDDTRRRLEEANRAYEERFGQVFLIRAAGRTPQEILAQIETRLQNDPDTENRVVAEQLREIAVQRLAQAVSE